MACSTLAHARRPSSALKMVELSTPTTMSHGATEMSCSTPRSRVRVWRVTDEAMPRRTTAYVAAVAPSDQNVPLGIDRLGLRNEPDMDKPASMPATAGKTTPKHDCHDSRTPCGSAEPLALAVKCGNRFSRSVRSDGPV